MKRAYLEKFFPTSRIILLRKKISGIQQEEGESFPTYYERFKSLVASCPQHQMKEELLFQYFYEGLLPLERQMLDASAGGALMDKTPMAAKILISNRALNAQQYEGVGQRGPPQHQVHEMAEGMKMQGPVDMSPKNVLNSSRMADGRVRMPLGFKAKISQDMIHNPTRIIRGGETTQISSGGIPNKLKIKEALGNNPRGSFPKPTAHPKIKPNPAQVPHEDQAKAMQNQDKRIAVFVGKFRDPGQLPSSTIPNPKGGFESAKAILLRSGKEIGAGSTPSQTGPKGDVNVQIEEEESSMPTTKVVPPLPQAPNVPNLPNSSHKGKNVSNSVHTNVFPSNVPFPSRFLQTKKEEAEKDILETFRKVQVNIPLLDAIKQVPRYARFLKELCTTRKRMSTKEVVKVGENVSAILQRKLPPKCKDPGSFTIPCVIGNTRFESAMLDLGASINVMPYSIYASMNLGALKNDGVNHLVFPANFYVLEMDDDRSIFMRLSLKDILHEMMQFGAFGAKK
ncbi:unnamed protein product [Malus baccata var. baccata]